MEETLDQKISDLMSRIKEFKSQRKSQLTIDDDCEYQEQLELRWHIDELEEELDGLLLQNRAEEEIEGW